MAVAVLFCSIGLGAQNNPYKIDNACYEIMSRAPDWALASAAVIQTAKSPAVKGRAFLCADGGTRTHTPYGTRS